VRAALPSCILRLARGISFLGGSMRPFDGVDFYRLDDQLTEDEKLVRQSVRAWVQEKYLPIVEDHFEKATFPTGLIPDIAELGVLGANLPTEYGCAGLGDVAYGLAMQELEAGDSGLRSFVSVQGALVMYPIFTFGSEEQKRYWLPLLASGNKIGCFGLTEPDFGSNPAGMATKAVRVKDGYVLSGAKMWITNGTISDVAVVWAKLDGRIQGFLVEKGWKGFSAPEQKRKFSLRASVTSELILQDVHVPETHLLPAAQGLKAPLSCLTAARYGIAWGALGAAMICYHTAVEYAKSRVQFDKPIASFQLIQAKLADMITEITKAQVLCLQLGRLKEKGQAAPEMVSLAKRNNVEIALEIARWSRDILGANGITGEYPVMRHMANLESVKTYEGTHNIHTLVLGEAVTGIGAYR
jgi:glutaryl-CoA dehydrogenase